jgi:hypothetical protein
MFRSIRSSSNVAAVVGLKLLCSHYACLGLYYVSRGSIYPLAYPVVMSRCPCVLCVYSYCYAQLLLHVRRYTSVTLYNFRISMETPKKTNKNLNQNNHCSVKDSNWVHSGHKHRVLSLHKQQPTCSTSYEISTAAIAFQLLFSYYEIKMPDTWNSYINSCNKKCIRSWKLNYYEDDCCNFWDIAPCTPM